MDGHFRNGINDMWGRWLFFSFFLIVYCASAIKHILREGGLQAIDYIGSLGTLG